MIVSSLFAPAKVFMPVIVIGRGARWCQARPVSQLFPLADRAEHQALPRHKTRPRPGEADACRAQHVVRLGEMITWILKL